MLLRKGSEKMKRLIKILCCLLPVLFLVSCSEGERANIALFAERFNTLGGKELSFSALSATETGEATQYSFVSSADEEGGKRVLVNVLENADKALFSCRLVIGKTDGKKSLSLSKEDISRFTADCERVLCAFSGFDLEKGKSLVSKLEIENGFLTSCEKTAQENEYYLVFLSNEVCCEVMMYNTYLKKIEETQKPESRAVYDSTTNIRTQTVPHK